MWTYSASSGECVGFFYNGCGATENVFLTEEQCKERCVKGRQGEGENKGEENNFFGIAVIRLKIVSLFPLLVLHIFAPSDEALSLLRSAVPGGGDGSYLFDGASPVAKHILLSSLTYDDCQGKSSAENIETLQPHFHLSCKGTIFSFFLLNILW